MKTDISGHSYSVVTLSGSVASWQSHSGSVMLFLIMANDNIRFCQFFRRRSRLRWTSHDHVHRLPRTPSCLSSSHSLSPPFLLSPPFTLCFFLQWPKCFVLLTVIWIRYDVFQNTRYMINTGLWVFVYCAWEHRTLPRTEWGYGHSKTRGWFVVWVCTD